MMEGTNHPRAHSLRSTRAAPLKGMQSVAARIMQADHVFVALRDPEKNGSLVSYRIDEEYQLVIRWDSPGKGLGEHVISIEDNPYAIAIPGVQVMFLQDLEGEALYLYFDCHPLEP